MENIKKIEAAEMAKKPTEATKVIETDWRIALLFIVVLLGIVVVPKAEDFVKVNKLVKSSDDLAKQGNYQDAYNNLTFTQTYWTTNQVKKNIDTKMSLDKQLISDQDNYQKGNDSFSQSNWQDAVDSYLKVSSEYPHFQESRAKIKQCQDKIGEASSEIEQAATQAKARVQAVTQAPVEVPPAEIASPKPATTIPVPSPRPIITCDDGAKLSAESQEDYQYQQSVNYEESRHNQASESLTLAANRSCTGGGDFYQSSCGTNQEALAQENSKYESNLLSLSKKHNANLASIKKTCY